MVFFQYDINQITNKKDNQILVLCCCSSVSSKELSFIIIENNGLNMDLNVKLLRILEQNIEEISLGSNPLSVLRLDIKSTIHKRKN